MPREITVGLVEGAILGCGDGPAAFKAVATERGHRVVSVDPIYVFSAADIERRIDQTTSAAPTKC